MEKDLFIEHATELLSSLVVEIEDRDDRADFEAVTQMLEEARDEFSELSENE